MIFHQYAHDPTGTTIHSSIQLEDNDIIVGDRPTIIGGLQTLHTPSEHVLPLTFVNGMARLPIRPYTDDEWDTLPHVHMTRDEQWDPSAYDTLQAPNDPWSERIRAETERTQLEFSMPTGATVQWRTLRQPRPGRLTVPIFKPRTLPAEILGSDETPNQRFHIRYNANDGSDTTRFTHEITSSLPDTPPPLEESTPPQSPTNHAEFFVTEYYNHADLFTRDYHTISFSQYVDDILARYH